MKNNLMKSFRMEIITYSLLSMLYTILTIVVIAIGVGIVYFSLGGKWPEQLPIQSMRPVPVQPAQPVQPSESPKSSEASLPVQNSIPTQNNPSDMNGKAQFEKEVQAFSGGWDSRTVIVIFILVLILVIMLFILYFLRMTKKFDTYIGSISEGIDELSKGNFKHVIEISAQDEFKEMTDKLNHMSVNMLSVVQKSSHNEDRKHELITSVAHDLRTPLTSVIGYLELLRSNKVDESTRQHYMDIVYNKSKRLEQLIEDLFSYTKYTYGNVGTITDAVDIVKLLEQLIEEFYPSFEDNHLTYEFTKDCNSLISYADGNLLARAFANLIGNAIKYGVDGKRVEIDLTHKESQMKIEVKNYGRIIPQEDLPHVFERFYRVEGSRSVETGGSGLGLAIAKSIVVMHHGDIAVKSSLNGTIFEIRLPILREPEAGE